MRKTSKQPVAPIIINDCVSSPDVKIVEQGLPEKKKKKCTCKNCSQTMETAWVEENTSFSDEVLGITGRYDKSTNILTIELSLKCGGLISVCNEVRYNSLFVAKQPDRNYDFPYSKKNWLRLIFDKNTSIPIELKHILSYNSEKEILTITYHTPNRDFAVNYGYYGCCDCTYINLLPGERWRKLARINGI